MTRSAEPDRGIGRGPRRLKRRLTGLRTRVRAVPGGTAAWRIGVTVLGVAVVAVGIVLLPLPGPGWLIIFAGLGVLATEYAWASQLLTRARRFLSDWTRWAASRGRWVQAVVGGFGLLLLAGVVAGSWYLYQLV
jgi:uncharacterized protein (TIGR02611 family)